MTGISPEYTRKNTCEAEKNPQDSNGKMQAKKASNEKLVIIFTRMVVQNKELCAILSTRK